jgi:putative PIN family toxin of toxin-antitoxin system
MPQRARACDFSGIVRVGIPWITSEVLIDELEEKLLRKLKISEADVAPILGKLRDEVEIVSPRPLSQPVSRDPDDDWVIATAVTGTCACIVTGDCDLLHLHAYGGIRIIEPGAFWEFEARAPEA